MEQQQQLAALTDYTSSIGEVSTTAEYAQQQQHSQVELTAQQVPESQDQVPKSAMDTEHPDQLQPEQQQPEQQQEQPVNELQAVQQQRQQYASWFHTYVAQQAGTADGNQVPVVDGALASHSVSQLIIDMHQASTAYAYVSSLKYWAEQVRELERAQRALRPMRGTSGFSPQMPTSELDAYKTMVSAAIQALSSALQAVEYIKYYAAPSEKLPMLSEAAATIDARMQLCRYELYTQLIGYANDLLEACAWPPPLASPGKHAQEHTPAVGLANGHMHGPSAADGSAGEEANNGGHLQPNSQQATGAADEQDALNNSAGQAGSSFTGFSQDPSRLSQLLTVLACLTNLQQVCESKAFTVTAEQHASGQQDRWQGEGQQQLELQQQQQHMEVPILWAAQVLAAPLQARLQSHFQPHTAAGRLDQPRWLFRLVLGLLQTHTPAVAELQPALDAAGLAGRCHMALEWARAVREACKVVLRTARLPALVQLWEEQQPHAGTVWSSYVDAMLEFERDMSPHLGGPASLQASSALPDALLPGSVLGCITQEPTCMAAWVAIQRQSALHALEAAAQQSDAWQADVDDSMTDGPLAGPSGRLGSLREFAAPRVALLVYGQLHSLVALSQHTPTADDQRVLLDQVGGDLLQRTAQLLTSHLQQISTWPGLASAEGAPVAGACVSAARYLHHMVSELLVGPALHRLHSSSSHVATAQAMGAAGEALPSSIASTPAAAVQQGARSLTPSPLKQSPGQLTDNLASPAVTPGLLGDVVVQHSFTPAAWDPPVLAAAVTHLGALHREWCLRIARELANLFGKGAADYMQLVSTSPEYPTHDGAAGTVTPALLPALTSLQAGLHALCGPLDGPSFRDIWRAVAVPINRLLFNHIATEAKFTSAGAQQFGVDCNAIAAVFTPYTKRPAAHFREALAAVKVLQLADDPEQVAQVVRVASQLAVSGTPLYRDAWLAELGLGCLTPAQLLAVLELRC